MLNMKSVIVAAQWMLVLLWPVSAYAATEVMSLGSGIEDLNVLAILATAVISSFSGLTALLHQMKMDLDAGVAIKSHKLYISSKMFGANLAGFLALCATEGQFDVNKQVGLIILASFGGIWFINQVILYIMDKFMPKRRTGDLNDKF